MTKLLSAPQVADLSGFSPDTIRRLIKRGYFPNAREVEVNGRTYWRVPESDVEEWVNPVQVGSSEEPPPSSDSVTAPPPWRNTVKQKEDE